VACSHGGESALLGLMRRRARESYRSRAGASSEGRRYQLRAILSDWRQRAPRQVEPRQLASLLGSLVSAAGCVPGGEVYMQGMLAHQTLFDQMRVQTVDWVRGVVRWKPTSRQRAHVRISDAFSRDLQWWSEATAPDIWNCKE